ncbi:FixH family protein [Antarcticibacterium flavum]|uniref:FixH family protein n=1 Tax=Antarcticibacterium flavum TaxID=2058175 RepID=A0A5B7X5U4_9FLAO|nr:MULTISPECIES: FixH family protein [Antarcticibacterium]MCM4158316.1 cytochrome C oxidase Cbb3 [Antarcticibacterium sp. W02-3]QCY70082.1 FixH family protein [Antarcticibacterium flavum]
MKINWGTSIVIAIMSFMAFILYLVITMTTNQEFNHDLVTEEYYKQELTFQDQLDRETNAKNLTTNIGVENTDEGIIINFPQDLDLNDIKGNINLYRPSNKEQDFTIPVDLKAHKVLIPARHLETGRWNIEINWTYGSESYYFKKELTF